MRQERVVGMAREGAARRTVHTSVSSRDRTKKAHRRVDLVMVLERLKWRFMAVGVSR